LPGGPRETKGREEQRDHGLNIAIRAMAQELIEPVIADAGPSYSG
jgi:hypothetical protein